MHHIIVIWDRPGKVFHGWGGILTRLVHATKAGQRVGKVMVTHLDHILCPSSGMSGEEAIL